MRQVKADFETYPIFSRPDFPPAPVGLAVLDPQRGSHYFAFGHEGGGNNGNEGQAHAVLADYWYDPTVELVWHNAKFDVAVAEERWGLQRQPWHKHHDTMLLAFLNNPMETRFGLKPLAEKYLGLPPDERDDVAGWVWEHKQYLEARWAQYSAPVHGPLKVQKGKEAAWMFAVPGDIAGPYAIGDVVRTGGLFEPMLAAVLKAGMGDAYDRERRLLPILMDNERRGMRVDLAGLETDIERYQKAFDYTENQLRFALKASGLNFDADQDVASVLISAGVIAETDFTRTKATKSHPNGQYSMSKELLLPDLFTGTTPTGVPGWMIASALGYRNRLATCLNTFMKPWAGQAARNKNYITTNWSQVRGEGGAKTGRATTFDFNFLNLPKDFDGRDDQYQHPAFLEVPELPLCRSYVLPDEEQVMLHRDFSGQELRVFGHFEQGALWEQYQANPRLDVHAFVGTELMRVAQREIERTKIKVMNFQSIYGGGAPALSNKLRVSLAEAKTLKQFHDQALPGRKILNEEIIRIARRGDPIRTWGGRLYWPTESDNGRETFYKLLNYLVQGSAADLTKQALIDWDEAQSAMEPWVEPARFMVTVYDEINLSAPVETAPQHMALLKQQMELPRLSVPMLSDGKWGSAWGKLEKYKDE